MNGTETNPTNPADSGTGTKPPKKNVKKKATRPSRPTLSEQFRAAQEQINSLKKQGNDFVNSVQERLDANDGALGKLIGFEGNLKNLQHALDLIIQVNQKLVSMNKELAGKGQRATKQKETLEEDKGTLMADLQKAVQSRKKAQLMALVECIVIIVLLVGLAIGIGGYVMSNSTSSPTTGESETSAQAAAPTATETTNTDSGTPKSTAGELSLPPVPPFEYQPVVETTGK